MTKHQRESQPASLRHVAKNPAVAPSPSPSLSSSDAELLLAGIKAAGGAAVTVSVVARELAAICVERAVAAQPTLEKSVVLRHLGTAFHDSPDLEAALSELHVDDLAFALACLGGDPGALRALETRLQAGSIRAVHRFYRTPELADEVYQLLRTHLLLGKGDKRPKLAEYGGRGPLDAWLRVVALRVALNFKPSPPITAGIEPNGLEQSLGLLIVNNPESLVLKGQHRSDVQAAFESALGLLPKDQRALLRLYVVDRLTVSEVGQLLGVHKSTASRQIERARQLFFKLAKRELGQRLQLTNSETESLMRAVQSQLDLSLALAGED